MSMPPLLTAAHMNTGIMNTVPAATANMTENTMSTTIMTMTAAAMIMESAATAGTTIIMRWMPEKQKRN